MKEKFQSMRFNADTRVLISRAVSIIEELQSQGYTLTLRQLYYQLVARDIIANKQKEYKRLGRIISDARLSGIVDWDAIEDRTRNIRSVPHWRNEGEIIASAADSFRLDKWTTQECRVEIWVEKDALIGVVERAARERDVSWFSCRGYTSQSELYGASKRLIRHLDSGQTPIVIHLGDHDPSGIDMTRDIEDRMRLFVGEHVEVNRIALNMRQIEELNPPPNPAKVTDSRFDAYERLHGDESWELDALDPRYIHDLILEKIDNYLDKDKFEEIEFEEHEKRSKLRESSNRWDEVAKFLAKKKK